MKKIFFTLIFLFFGLQNPVTKESINTGLPAATF